MASMWRVQLTAKDSSNKPVTVTYDLVRQWPDGGQVEAVNAMAQANGWTCTMTPHTAFHEVSELEERFKRYLR